MRLPLFLCLGLATFSQALPDTIKDWHKPLTGIPITHTRSLAPRFHRRQEGRRTHSHIYVATEKNTIAALQPTYGTIVWRHVYDDADRLVHFRAHGPFLSTLSGPGGANLRILEATSGHILWELPLHNASLGRLSEPADVGVDISYAPTVEDVTVLSNSNTVRRVSILDGSTKWAWTAGDDVSLNLHSRLLQDEKNTYVIGLSKSFAGYTIHVTVIDSSSGKETVSYPVPGNLPTGIDDILVLEHRSEPSLFWVENGTIKWLSLANRKVTTLKGKDFARLVDLGLGEQGMFVAQEADENTSVYSFYATETGFEPRQLFVFADSARSDRQSPSIYTGGIDKDSMPYISRTFYSFVAQTAAISLFVPHGSNGTGLMTGIPIAHDTLSQGIITHVALDVAPVGDNQYLTRALLSNTLGAVQLWKGYELQWTREESLSDLQAIEFVDLPEQSLLEGSGAGARLEATIKKIIAMGEAIVAMSKSAKVAINDQLVQFISGRKPTHTEEETTTPLTDPNAGLGKDALHSLSRDAFGFRKIIVTVTSAGKIYGIDSANGNILWNRILGLDMGKIVQNPSLHVIKSVLDGAITPIVAVIANKQDGSGTAVLHLDAMTGKVQPPGVVPPYFASKSFSDAFTSPAGNRSIILISKDNKVSVYPHSLSSAGAAQLQNIYYTKTSGVPVHRQLTGYSLELSSEATSAIESKLAWSLGLGPEETIQYTFRRPQNPIASLGKVLADRKTLYKYLNPHTVGVVTRSSKPGGSQSVYLIDGVTGVILYHTSVNSDGKVLAAMTENWLVFAFEVFGSELAGDQTKGQHIVSVELYEGFARNDKTRSSDISSHAPEMERLTAHQHSFMLPYSITAIGMTSTKYGISTKDLIVSTVKGQIHAIPRRLLDPRRHQDKPSAADGEELLLPYDPLIPDDHRRVLSKQFDVIGAKTILTSPALLESTSLVFAHGQDLFFTKTSPSGTFDLLSESFNKIQLIVTIAGLSAAILVTRPIVQRRQLKQQWYS